MGVCKYCGSPVFGKNHHGKEKTYCNAHCRNAARRTFGVAVCFECGKTFKETRDRPNKFCSKSCSALYNARLKAIEKAENDTTKPETAKEIKETIEKLKVLTERAKREKQCAFCGKWFISNNGAQLCSDECRRKHDNVLHDKRLARNGRPDNSITLPRVFDRDKGICAICGRELNFDCNRASGDYPSIDHIKPISKGGLHRWNNVQLTCRACNMKKSDKWEE